MSARTCSRPALALLVTSLLSATALGSPITFTQQTSGWVGTSNTGVVTLNPTPTTTPLVAPGPLTLGSFFVQGQPDGVTVNYNNVPFRIFTNMQAVGTSQPTNLYLTINGVLNGSITGSTHSDLVATITSTTPSSVGTELYPASLIQYSGPVTLAPNGTTTLTAVLPTPFTITTPEPATLAIFGAAFAGMLALRTRRRLA